MINAFNQILYDDYSSRERQITDIVTEHLALTCKNISRISSYVIKRNKK